jgi:hypothetical protein
VNDFYAASLLAARKISEETGLMDAEILQLDMKEYTRLTGRQTPVQAAIQALDAPYTVPRQPASREAAPDATPQGVDVSQLSMSEYAAVRGRLGVGGREYGRGVLDGGSTADWIAAARLKAGRAAMQAGNVQEAAQPDSGKYLTGNEPVTGRASFYR